MPPNLMKKWQLNIYCFPNDLLLSCYLSVSFLFCHYFYVTFFTTFALFLVRTASPLHFYRKKVA